MQDEASQLVAHVLGARAGERVLDVCAAPGSKTTHVAALACDEAKIAAGDLYEHRLRLVNEACARLGVRSVSAVVLDAEDALPFADGAFDRVLVDAPCTGTGTLRHNPEIRWRLAPTDIAELAARQRKILAEAARTVRRGGRLVYSTCSVEREENEAVVADFLADTRRLQASPRAPRPRRTARALGRRAHVAAPTGHGRLLRRRDGKGRGKRVKGEEAKRGRRMMRGTLLLILPLRPSPFSPFPPVVLLRGGGC